MFYFKLKSPENTIIKHGRDSHTAILMRLRQLLLSYGGLPWAIYIVLIALVSYKEPVVGIMGSLLFMMIFTWESVGRTLEHLYYRV